MKDTRPVGKPEVGQIYAGWGKSWKVVEVHDESTTAKIVNVERPENTARLPWTQFAQMEAK